MTEATSQREKRAARRYSCAGAADIMVPGCGLHYEGRIVDLSAGGCFIETECRLERGTAVELGMKARGFPLRLAANLVVRRAGGIGFRFHSVSARKLELIRMLIEELEEEQAASRPADAATDGLPPTQAGMAAVKAVAERGCRGSFWARLWGWVGTNCLRAR